jgi:predicted HicB family RNase H-like nuclease
MLFLKHLGLATPESTSKISMERPSLTKSVKHFVPLKNLRNNMNTDRYTYRVTWSAPDKMHIGLCAEFPSLSWLDKSPESALKGIRKIVAEVVMDMLDSNEQVPEPLSEKTFSGKFVVRVPAEIHRLLAVQAAEQGISMNRWVSAKLAA